MTIAEQIAALEAAFKAFQKANDDALKLKADSGHIPEAMQKHVDELNTSVGTMKDDLKEMVAMQKRVDEMETLLARPDAMGGNAEAQAQERMAAATLVSLKTGASVDVVMRAGETAMDLEGYRSYKSAFVKLLRGPGTLTQEDKMALTVGTDPQGGYWVPPDVSGRMIKFIYQTSPMRNLATSLMIGTDALEGPLDLDEGSSGWVGEQDSRPETATPTVGEYRIDVWEQYALPKMTQKVLDDAQFPVESWLMDKTATKMARSENTGFVTGNGVKKPRGFLTYPAGTPTKTNFKVIEQVNSGAAADFSATDPGDEFIDLTFKLKAPLRTGSTWVMNSQTEAKVRKFKDGQGNYLWQPNFGAQTGGLLLGYPVVNFEDMPDVAANALAVGFGNFREAYQIVDRMGIRLLRDPYTQKGYQLFYMTKRVGGDVVNFEALKLMKIAV